MSARRVRSLAAHHGVEESILAAGMSVATGQGVVIEVLHPPRGLVPGAVHAIALRAPWGRLVPLPRAGRWAELAAAELTAFRGPPPDHTSGP